MSKHNYRLYTFVAGNYLSDLQKGIQTAHVVSDLSQECYNPETPQGIMYATWASVDKTIIVCNAMNHFGVQQAYTGINEFKDLKLPFTIFYEDEASMNEMATAAGVIVPQKYYDVKFNPRLSGSGGSWEHTDADRNLHIYTDIGTDEDTLEFRFITLLKSFRLA